MTNFPDIMGLDKCARRTIIQDIVDKKGWEMLEKIFPGLHEEAKAVFGAGSRPHIPRTLETPRARAKRMDNGKMSIAALALVAQVAYITARRAREERA